MISTASAVIAIISALLKLVNLLVDVAQQNKWMKAGADAEIAKTSAAILAKTAAGKAIMEKVNALSDSDVDIALRGLEPK
jgi:hypothetical protein